MVEPEVLKVAYLPALLTAPNEEYYGRYDHDKALTTWGKKMRLFDENSSEGPKKAESLKGVFSDSHSHKSSFDRTLNKFKDVDVIPTKSITEVGIQPTRYKFDDLSQKDEKLASIAFSSKASMNESKTRVRVFGFDPSKTEAILKYFMAFGNLVEPCSSQGNWITFKYTTHEAALKALKCHGKVMHQRMIGVVWDDSITELQTVRLLPAEDIFLQTQAYNDSKSSINNSSNHVPKDSNNSTVKPSGFLHKIREILMGW
ncbi:uncharacterized protein BX663DRAFT_19286 [Cokeromyces recurvatus]|uniref:uncharacterized protein n=1 Tax=Cokeromyces recurvatus TaxID=90255 RepID=UPI002220C917|nr:uncharacterized protein BX663DRAFT_19286 [Cokeromyces recurvatus]KAI7908067.1 hypothetical protein BX663DRAFT_19286 [Cokeromyces recurvatus]